MESCGRRTDRKLLHVIYAHDDAGQSNGTQAQMIAAGTPYNAIDESFADRKLSYVWRVGKKNGGEWKLLDDTTVTGLKSYDNDNGFMGCGGSAVDDGGDLLSGKIDLRNMSAPGLKFYVYNIQDDEMSPDLNEVKVQIKTADSDLVEIFNNSISGIAGADAPAGWYRVTIPLSEFKDDIIQFQISFALKTMDSRRLLIKRLVDIIGALVGLAMTAVITTFVALLPMANL